MVPADCLSVIRSLVLWTPIYDFFFFCINVSTAISTTIFKIIHVGISFKGMVFISLFNNIKYQWSWPLTISSNHFIPEFKSVLKLNVSNQKSWYHAVSLVFVFLFFFNLAAFFFFKKKNRYHIDENEMNAQGLWPHLLPEWRQTKLQPEINSSIF